MQIREKMSQSILCNCFKKKIRYDIYEKNKMFNVVIESTDEYAKKNQSICEM